MAKKHRVGIEIQTEAKGKGAQATEKALEGVEQSAEDLRRELDKIKGLDPKVRKQIEGVAGSMDRAAATGQELAGAQAKTAKSSKNSGLAMLEFSRAVEDAQYGVRGVLNNIPQLLMFMGAGGGLAGVVSLAAVALTTLVTQMGKADEKTLELTKSLETARRQVDEFYAESARDGTAAFRANAKAVVESLERQNTALTENLKLVREKRQAELEVAAAGRDLDLATIAGREASGELSPEQADEARRAVELARLRTAAEEKILQAQEDLALQQELRNENARQQREIDERLGAAKERELELVEERNTLLSKKEVAERFREEGQKKIKDSGFFSPGKKIEGEGLIDRANLNFSESQQERLVQLERVILPQQEQLTATLEALLATRQSEQGELSRAQGAAFNAAELTKETQGDLLALKEATLEAQASTEAIKKSTTDLKAGVDQLGSLAKEAEATTGQERTLVRDSQEVLKRVLSDGVITAQEFAETERVLARLVTAQGSAQSDLAATIKTMQASISTLQREARELKQNALRISSNSGG